MQQQAEAEAARKAAEEYATLNALRNGNQESSDNIPPELVDEKAKSAPNTQNKTTEYSERTAVRSSEEGSSAQAGS